MRWPLVWRSTYEQALNDQQYAQRSVAIALRVTDHLKAEEVDVIHQGGPVANQYIDNGLRRMGTEMMQLRRSSEIDVEAFRDDPQAQYRASDNAQASEVKSRQVKAVNVELRGIIGEAADTFRKLSNDPAVIDYADKLERFA